MHDPDDIFERWKEAIRHAYSLAHAERVATLHCRTYKRFDTRGLHQFSEECGRVAELERMMPELTYAGFNPLAVRREAETDATAAFVQQVAA